MFKNVLRFIINPFRVFFRIDTRTQVDLFEKHAWISVVLALATTALILALYYLVLKK